MGLFDVFRISATGLRAQRQRMEIIADNLANIHSTRTEEGGPFRKKEPVFVTSDLSRGGFRSAFDQKLEGVKMDEVVESAKPFERAFDPGHPDADKDGYVTLPNVNVVEEMADMMTATRSYEANITIVNTTKQMFLKALEIGR